MPLINRKAIGFPGGLNPMAKGQKKSSREARKPKAEHNQKKKTNVSNPSMKTGVVNGLEHMKTKS